MKHNMEKTEGSKKGGNGFLTSLKLTIALLLLLAAVSVIGTVIPQNLTEGEYLRHYSSASYNSLKALGIFDIYHSWCFILLLFLLCTNLLACSIKNVPRTLRILTQVSPLLTDDQIKKLTLTSRIDKKISLNEARSQIVRILKKNFGSPHETLDNGTRHFFCEKARYSRLGFFITHVSVIIILIGGLIGSLWGFKGNVEIFEGDSAHQIRLQNGLIFDLGFMVRCDDFNVTYYPNGAPKDYKSSLTIFENGKKVLTKIIEVNHPLKYKGLVFYQESFGEVTDQEGEVTLRVMKRGSKEPGRVFQVKVGESFILPTTGLKIKLNRFFPDFVLDENGTVINRSFALHNPALELLIFKSDELQTKTWVFQKFPDFHGSKGEYQFLIQDIKGKVYTGLQVTKDPGVNVVWTGCILMILGILGTFFFSHQQIWIRTKSAGNNLELVMAGTARKNRIGFEKVFERLKSEIEKI
jgi:cytochrome c biogenesis protein